MKEGDPWAPLSSSAGGEPVPHGGRKECLRHARGGVHSGGGVGVFCVLLGSVLFSTKAVLVKMAFGAAPVAPITLLALRMLFSVPFFAGMAWWTSRKAPPLLRRQWAVVAVLGLLGYYVSSLLDFSGLQYISAGLERLLLFVYPTLVLLINRLLWKTPVRRIQLVASLITYAGIGLAYAGEVQWRPQGAGFVLGCALVLGCATTYAVYIAGSAKVIPAVGATRFTAWAMLSATVGVLSHFALAHDPASLTAQPASVYGYSVLMALLATVLPTLLIAQGLRRIASNNAAILSAIGPVSTIVQAYYFLGEPITLWQVLGTALVVVGVWRLGARG